MYKYIKNELCDRANMGVCAVIAFNNHIANGNWANLEYKIKNKQKWNKIWIKILKIVKNEIIIPKKYIVKGKNIE